MKKNCVPLFVVLALSLLVFLPQTINCSSLPEPLELYQGYLHDIYHRHAFPILAKPLEVSALYHPKQPLKLVLVPREKNKTDWSFLKQHMSMFLKEMLMEFGIKNLQLKLKNWTNSRRETSSTLCSH